MPFVTIRGEKVHYQVENGMNKNLPSGVFIHGARGTSKRWLQQMENLKHVCRLIALDLPGHGESKGAPLSSIAEMSKFIYEFISELAINGFILIGHSMGGAISIDYALKYPNNLIGLVLVGTAHRFNIPQANLDMLSRGIKPFQSISLGFAANASQELIRQSEAELEAASLEACLNDLTACNDFDCTDSIHLIKVPTLILCGNEDNITPPGEANFLKAKIEGSRLVLIHGAGHFPMLEQPQTVNQELEWFFRCNPNYQA